MTTAYKIANARSKFHWSPSARTRNSYITTCRRTGRAIARDAKRDFNSHGLDTDSDMAAADNADAAIQNAA